MPGACTMLFKHLFAPHEIRGLEIRHRINTTSRQTMLVEKGESGEKMAACQEAQPPRG